MKGKHLLTAGLTCSLFAGQAQITEIGVVNNFSVLQTLPSVGQKFVEMTGQTGFILRNLDLSVFQTVTYGTAPAGTQWTGPGLITESLFDTDPSTIEYLVMAVDQSDWTWTTFIFRTDGTQLLMAEGQRFLYEPTAINTPDGTLMFLYSPDISGVHSNAHVYSLPGIVPCVACDGTISAEGMMLGTDDGMGIQGGIRAFPNPAGTQATISYTLPLDAGRATLVISALNGAVVSRMAITNSGTKTITTADLAAGTYLYHIETDDGVIGAKRLMVVK